MKKILLINVIFSLLLASCFDNSKQYISQYVGDYTVGANYYREYHYYWGNDTLKNEKKLISGDLKLSIKDDGSVIASYGGEETQKGKVRCDEKTIQFKGIDGLGKYKFNYKKEGHEIFLDYYYREEKHLLEYDYHTERLSFTSRESVVEKDEQIFNCTIAEYDKKEVANNGKYQNTIIYNKNYNKLIDSSLTVSFVNNNFSLKKGEEMWSGNISFNENRYTFLFDDEETPFPSEMKFIKVNSGSYSYLEARLEKKEILEDKEIIESYWINFHSVN